MILTSCLLGLWGCATVYKDLSSAKGDIGDLRSFKPAFSVSLYSATIDVVGNHLSGLLLIKKMPDSTTRMVFSNEMGFKFFDFEFSPGGGFKVYAVYKKMNRKAVLKTLRHDFELLLMEPLKQEELKVKSDSAGNRYYIFPKGKGYYCYVLSADGKELVRMERSSKEEPVATAIMQQYHNGIPDTIGFTHHKVDFLIGLKRLER